MEKLFVSYHNFKEEGFVGLNVGWKGVCFKFVHVYASCSFVIRKITWRDLVVRRRKSVGQ